MDSEQEIVFEQKLNVNDLAELGPCTWGMDGQLGLCICENLYYSAICSQEFDSTNTLVCTACTLGAEVRMNLLRPPFSQIGVNAH